MGKAITLRRDGRCERCGEVVPAGGRAWYTGRVWHVRAECPAVPTEERDALRRGERPAPRPTAPVSGAVRDPGEDAADRWSETHGGGR